MAYDQKIKDAVRADYIFKHLNLKQISKLHSITYDTIRSWKQKAEDNGDNWDTARNAARVANGGGIEEVSNMLIENFAIQTQSVIEAINADEDLPAKEKVAMLTSLSDGYSKLIASVNKSGGKVAPLSIAMNVVRLMTDFIRSEFPQHADVFIEVLEPFGNVLAKELG